jgi:hypothetical protein
MARLCAARRGDDQVVGPFGQGHHAVEVAIRHVRARAAVVIADLQIEPETTLRDSPADRAQPDNAHPLA